MEKEKKKDNFVFTETALKDFIAKDKPRSTELEKQQEEDRRTSKRSDVEIRRAATPKEKTPMSVPPVKGRPTFSLFGLGGGKPETIPIANVAVTSAAVAPRGVPTIAKWKLDPADNSITGLISGSASYEDGEPVTTSPIVDEAAPNTVVRTKSGSRYLLGPEDTSKGLFSFFSGGAVKLWFGIAGER